MPLAPAVNIDTIIQRHQSCSAPGGSTTLTMTALSLKSISPITVTYQRQRTESWNVQVGLSDLQGFDRDDDNKFQLRLTQR